MPRKYNARREDRKWREEKKAMERQGQAKDRGIKNPPDIQVLSSGERKSLKSAKKRYEHETAMAERYEEKGTFDKATTDRVKKDVENTYKGKKAEARRRSEKRKKDSSARYRKGVKAY
jgi:hypothetical protein